MKFSENSLVVDVIKISNSSYKLSVPAGDLLTAAMNGAVLRRHDLSTAAVPNVLYVPLSEAKLSSGSYSFAFANGDKFTASAADAYPTAESVSDETGSGSGGGVLVVTDTEGTLDKTWQEIHDAMLVGGVVVDKSTILSRDVEAVARVFDGLGVFNVVLVSTERTYVVSSASGYPTDA